MPPFAGSALPGRRWETGIKTKGHEYPFPFLLGFLPVHSFTFVRYNRRASRARGGFPTLDIVPQTGEKVKM